jgi:hypothetical protein
MDYASRKMKAMLEQADKTGATYALIVGDDEIERGLVQVRDMRSKQQVEVPVAHLAEALRGGPPDPDGTSPPDPEGEIAPSARPPPLPLRCARSFPSPCRERGQGSGPPARA